MNKRKLITRYITFDMIAAVIVWILFLIFRKTVSDAKVFGVVPVLVPNYDFFTSLLLFPLSCIFIHYLSGYYNNPIKESKVGEFFTTLIAAAIISLVIFFVLMLDDIVVSYQYYYYSLLTLLGLLFVVTYFFRVLISSSVRGAFRKKKITLNTLIIGTGNNALKIGGEVEKNSMYNTIVGYVETEKNTPVVSSEKVIGNLKNIKNIISEYNIKEAIIAVENADEQKLFDIINQLYQFDIDIQFTPRLYEILTGRVKINKFGINPLVSINKVSMPEWEQSVKRFFDIIISLFSLVILLPVIIYFGIVIKKDSKGPVFFRQPRIGKHGKPFSMLKLRTMYQNSENGLPKLSSPTDKRITKVGRVLRKYRLDEVPQFWNILKGDMSIVGPRPERQFYIDQIIQRAPYYCLLYRIRPGLTSWGPIKIGYSDTIDKMIERLNYDIVYMENMSLVNDAKILIFTLEIIFKGKGV